MAYETLASSSTPALVVYVLDVSASMARPLGDRRRVDVVTRALAVVLRQMVFRSTKGIRIAPRYRVAMFAYSDDVYDLLGGVQTVDQVVNLGVPTLTPMAGTETAKAFTQVERLLHRELADGIEAPAPLVCHMTDSDYTGPDPEPIVRRIMGMQTPDGNVLVENIFLSDVVTAEPIPPPSRWGGILPSTPMASEYGACLRSMSSTLPESYLLSMREAGYPIAEGAVMMLPGSTPELVEMGFAMSAATPVARTT